MGGLRDQIFLQLSPSLLITLLIFNKRASTKLPFHIDRRGTNSFRLPTTVRNPAFGGGPAAPERGFRLYILSRPFPPPSIQYRGAPPPYSIWAYLYLDLGEREPIDLWGGPLGGPPI